MDTKHNPAKKDLPPFVPSAFPTKLGVSNLPKPGFYADSNIARKNLEALKWFADVPLKSVGKVTSGLRDAISPLIDPPQAKPAPFDATVINFAQEDQSYASLAEQMAAREFALVRISSGAGSETKVENMLVRNDAVDSKNTQQAGALLVSLDGKNFEPLMIDACDGNRLIPLSEWIKKYDSAPAPVARPPMKPRTRNDTKMSIPATAKIEPRENVVPNSLYKEFTFSQVPGYAQLRALLQDRDGAHIRIVAPDAAKWSCFVSKGSADCKGSESTYDALFLADDENSRTQNELSPETCESDIRARLAMSSSCGPANKPNPISTSTSSASASSSSSSSSSSHSEFSARSPATARSGSKDEI